MSNGRIETLNRLKKNIEIREDELARKANSTDNLTTASGYFAAAGALNWVRTVLIDAELSKMVRQ